MNWCNKVNTWGWMRKEAGHHLAVLMKNILPSCFCWLWLQERQKEKATNPTHDSWSILVYELLCLWRWEKVAGSISLCPVIDFNVDPHCQLCPSPEQTKCERNLFLFTRHNPAEWFIFRVFRHLWCKQGVWYRAASWDS